MLAEAHMRPNDWDIGQKTVTQTTRRPALRTKPSTATGWEAMIADWLKKNCARNDHFYENCGPA